MKVICKMTLQWGFRLLIWASNWFDKFIPKKPIFGETAKFASFMPRIK